MAYNTSMLIYLAVIIVLSLLLVAMLLFIGYQAVFSITMLHGPVFVPSADEKLQAMLELPKVPKNAKIVDMGSGDGKVVIALAKKFKTKVEGVEINPILVRRSRKNIDKAGLSDQITIISKSFWDVDLRQYDTVFMYGTSYIMKKLEKKVQQEMKPGSQFVSNFFQFPNLKPVKTVNGVHLYQF